MQAVRKVNGGILWANLHLLFWLSLVPFVTGWMGENHFAALTVSLYGVVLLFAGVAYYILSQALIAHHGKHSELATAIGRDIKGMTSVVVYIAGIAASLMNPWIGFGLYCLVALMWLIPDRRIEKVIHD